MMSSKNIKVTILSDPDTWMNQYIPHLRIQFEGRGISVDVIHQPEDLTPGDVAFFLSCGQIITATKLKCHEHNLVVHASNLPQGRGWSPLTWQILEGKNHIPVSLIKAENKVDSGQIYLQDTLFLQGHELIDECRSKLADVVINLCLQFIDNFPDVLSYGKTQKGKATYYPKRTPDNSELDINKTIDAQFNLLRIVDNEKSPAYFVKEGVRYKIVVTKEILDES